MLEYLYLIDCEHELGLLLIPFSPISFLLYAKYAQWHVVRQIRLFIHFAPQFQLISAHRHLSFSTISLQTLQ